ncbi:MAG: phosphate acetyltransferase [Micrococcales bacterium]|nr:phosphate acetyltransferase [Micrococcales bacterium]
MTAAIYITSLAPSSGKSLVSLGAVEAAASRTANVGYFRPVIAASETPDAQIEMMRRRYQLSQTYEQSFGVTTQATRGVGHHVPPELVHRILTRYEELARECDVVIVEGTDFTGASAAFEFALNAEIAANLGAATVVVVPARHDGTQQLVAALDAARLGLAEHQVTLFGFVVNRVPDAERQTIAEAVAQADGTPVWFLPELPELERPAVSDLTAALGAEQLTGDEDSLGRGVRNVIIGAMTLPHLIERLTPDTLVIAPGDRSDVLLLAQASRMESDLPRIAGVLLTGGYQPDPIMLGFIHGSGSDSVPIMLTDRDTFETADIISRTRGTLESGDEARLDLALRMFQESVAVDELADRLIATRPDQVTPVMFERRLVAQARSVPQHIVLPEGEDDRILLAAQRIRLRKAAELTVLGDREDIQQRAERLGIDLAGLNLINPSTSSDRQRYADEIQRLRAHKGMSAETAWDLAADPTWFGTLMVQLGDAGGMVSGAAHTTADTVRPALQIIRTAPDISVVSSVFLMVLPERVFVYGDCAVLPHPNAEQLADIAVSSAATAAAFGIDPRVAMLSYSTGSSGVGADVEKVTQATAMVREREPSLLVEGPIQFDAAVDPQVARAKLPGSEVAGRATVLIFPDLNTGNNTYKAVQRSGGAMAVGPVLQGLRLPVNDLSRGATVDDIVNTVVITAIQAQRLHEDG